MAAAALAIGGGVLGSGGAKAQHGQTLLVKMPDGRIVRVPADPTSGAPLVALPALAQAVGTESTSAAAAGQQQSSKTSSRPAGSPGGPSSTGGGPQTKSGQRRRPRKPKAGPTAPSPPRSAPRPAPSPIRGRNGTPTTQNPTFFNALPAPSNSSQVPNFLISHFRVPIFLLPIYQAAGNQYSIPWEVLAAINEIETDYGRNLSVSTAGAVGWMQFLPSTWKRWGVDANGDHKKDPYNPADAIFAAARYLNAAGGRKHIRQAIFAYNHAAWYVDSVMLRAKLIAGVPEPLIGSLTGLTEGRFPVAAHARYADDAIERQAVAQHSPLKGQGSNLASDRGDRNSINIFTADNAPVVATTDGVIKKIGKSGRRGNYIVLHDAYGNEYTYSGLGSIAAVYPVPKDEAVFFGVKVVAAHAEKAPTSAATAGRQLPGSSGAGASAATAPAGSPRPRVVYRRRIFAHPARAGAMAAGSVAQLFDESGSRFGFSQYDARIAGALGLNRHNAVLRPLREGSRVISGTLLGRVGKTEPGKAPHLNFQIRPAGKRAPTIDPKPILDGWKLLETTAVLGRHGRNALSGTLSIGQILLMPKSLLERRVLSDPRVKLPARARGDTRTHQVDRRVLAMLEFLAESGLQPTVSALRPGNVEISKINGTPVRGHQHKGGIVESAVKKLMTLQGTVRPHEIVSLFDFGGNTRALPDHADHLRIGFRPRFGSNKKLGGQVAAILKPGQWTDLIARLRTLQNPRVSTTTSIYALPTHGRR